MWFSSMIPCPAPRAYAIPAKPVTAVPGVVATKATGVVLTTPMVRAGCLARAETSSGFQLFEQPAPRATVATAQQAARIGATIAIRIVGSSAPGQMNGQIQRRSSSKSGTDGAGTAK